MDPFVNTFFNSSYKALLYVMIFFIPGFLIHNLQNALNPKFEESKHLQIFKFLTYSCLNYLPYVPIIFLLIHNNNKNSFLSDHPIWFSLIVIFLVFIHPLIIGIISFFIHKTECIKKIANKFGFPFFSNHQTAWDKCFISKNAAWLLITMKNGEEVLGKYQKGCSASLSDKETYGKASDIYIIDVHSWDKKKKKWYIPSGSPAPSMWLSGEEIRHIKFWEGG